ncbi:MAG: hypothetical protein H7Y17_17585, partial [Chlorobia bacterium]|nr:hypothetical protein [Fimbriimonadaceae bacterium]
NGKPQGLWWTMSFGDGKKAGTFVFLPNGIHASNPRYGAGNLVDIEGQKAQAGVNGVGPFSISGGQITRQHDGFSSTDPYTTGTDSSGRFFKIGEAVYRPLAAPTKQSLVGTWRVPGNKYVFNMNGTYEAGQTVDGGDWVATSVVSGTYAIDGHLVVFRPKDGPMAIIPIGMVGKDIMLASGLLFKKS